MLKKGLIFAAYFLIFILFLSPVAFAQEIAQEVAQEPISNEINEEPIPDTYSAAEKVVDNVKLVFSGGDRKAEFALEIREKQINEVIEAFKAGDTERAIEGLEDAKEKLEIVQEIASPDVAEKIDASVKEITNKIMESKDINPQVSAYLEQHLSEERKTLLSSDLSEKMFAYCEELAVQDYEAMLKDEKCNPENAPKWMEDKIEEKIEGNQKQIAEEMINQLTICMTDPRECDCSKIPTVNERAKCEKGTALSIRCEFQNDESACRQLGEIGPPEMPSNMPAFLRPLFQKTMDDLISKKESQMFDKFAPPECKEAGATSRQACESIMMQKNAPRECIEAGATTKEECEKIMVGIHGPPPTECMENGEFIGPEACEQKMVESGMIPQECIKNRKPLPPEECEAIMKEKRPKMGEIPQECIKDGQPIPEEECIAIMKEKGMMIGVPKECGGKSPEECDKIMKELGITPGIKEGEGILSGECREKGIFDYEKCQEIVMLPRPCKDLGIYTAEACETHMMATHLPEECVKAGTLTPEACKKELLPKECQNAGIFSRAECDALIMSKDMPKECVVEGKILPPEECAGKMADYKIEVSPGSELDYLFKQGISLGQVPGVCMSGSNFVRSMDCDAALAGINIKLPPPTDISNIPAECVKDGVPLDPQECQTILESKIIIDTIPFECRETGIETPEDCGKFMDEQRKRAGIGMDMPEECFGKPVEECKNIIEEKPCEEGKPCGPGKIGPPLPITGEPETPTPTKDCQELGITDSESCNFVMSKINEERIKNGDKMIVDKNGNQDYISNDEINQLAERAERRAEEAIPDFKKAEGIKDEIVQIEKNIQVIDESFKTAVTKVEGGAGDLEVAGEAAPSGGVEVASGGGEVQGGGESAPSGGGSEGGGESSSGGGGGEVTGGVIGVEFEKTGLLTNILEKIKKVF